VTPAGSLRRGRETVGDLDLLATGPGLRTGTYGWQPWSTWPLTLAFTT
jgi:hypothetical protein